MKKKFFWGACLVALFSQPVMAQTGGAEVVVVRVLEASGRATVLIARDAEAAPERIEFTWNDGANSGKSAATSYYTIFSKLFAQGYQLQATIPGVGSSTTPIINGFTYSTLLFTKPKSK